MNNLMSVAQHVLRSKITHKKLDNHHHHHHHHHHHVHEGLGVFPVP
jgi:hypothetical protein